MIVSGPPTARWQTAPPVAVEVRLDLVRGDRTRRAGKIIPAWRELGASILLTARRVSDGGAWPDREEASRRQSLIDCLSLDVDAVDLETTVLADARFRRTIRARLGVRGAVIASLHRFGRFPRMALLDREATAAARRGADRFKVAVAVADFDEADRLADWALERAGRTIPVTAIAMGKKGRWTRWVLPSLLGGPAYAPAGRAVAPGQISFGRLVDLLGVS